MRSEHEQLCWVQSLQIGFVSANWKNFVINDAMQNPVNQRLPTPAVSSFYDSLSDFAGGYVKFTFIDDER